MVAQNKYRIYKENQGDKVWWVDNHEVTGEFLFTIDKKKVYNLFRDYPHKLSVEEWMIFNAENPYWMDFFDDRNAEYISEHAEEIAKVLNNKG